MGNRVTAGRGAMGFDTIFARENAPFSRLSVGMIDYYNPNTYLIYGPDISTYKAMNFRLELEPPSLTPQKIKRRIMAPTFTN